MAPIERVTIIAAHTDGSQSIFHCENPVQPELVISTPLDVGPLRGSLEALAPFAIAGPDLSSVKVEFRAHPRHGIVTEQVSQPLPDVVWAFRKATGWSLQQAVDYAAAIDGFMPRYPPLAAPLPADDRP